MAEYTPTKNTFLDISDIGIQTETQINGFGPARRSKYILHYVMRGSGYYEVDNTVYYISAGQSFIIYPGEVATYYPDQNDPWVYAWVNFIGMEADSLLRHIGFTKSNRVAPVIAASKIMPFFEGFSMPAGSHALGCRNNGYLHLLLALYMDVFPHEASGLSENLLCVSQYIDEHLNDAQLTVQELCNIFWLSRSQLYREFESGFGLSPNRYITQLRMMKAISLIRQGERSVKNIAYATGYSDQMYFSKVFKHNTGTTPTDLMKNIERESIQSDAQETH